MCLNFELFLIACIFPKVLALMILYKTFLDIDPITTLKSPFDLCVRLFNLIVFEFCQTYDRWRFTWDGESCLRIVKTSLNTWDLRETLTSNFKIRLATYVGLECKQWNPCLSYLFKTQGDCSLSHASCFCSSKVSCAEVFL